MFYAKGTSAMFYTLFSAEGASVSVENEDIPLFIWLQGGPGGSSQFGAFTEIGPIKIKKSVLSLNDKGWNHQGHLLFIDSPLNVGFSHTDDR